MVNRQAIILLHDIVRVIGFEVAAVYGGDFRHRDPNWIYGAELTDLISRFPMSHRALSQGLKEIGGLALRNQYDRIHLYRLLAEHQSARPKRYRAGICLTGLQRQAIAGRLEKFFETFMDEQPPDQMTKWQHDVESRLGVRLKVVGESPTESVPQQLEEAVRSLAGFLLEIKHREPDELYELLVGTGVAQRLDTEVQVQLLDDIKQNPPFFFEMPNLDPQSDAGQEFFKELLDLAVRFPPYTEETDQPIIDCAAYLRMDVEVARRSLNARYAAQLVEKSTCDLSQRIPQEAIRAVLTQLQPDSAARCLYGEVTLADPSIAVDSDESAWLLGTDEKLVAFSVAGSPQMIWQGDKDVQIARAGTILNAVCELRGGQWLNDECSVEPILRVPCPLIQSYDRYFAPLYALLDST